MAETGEIITLREQIANHLEYNAEVPLPQKYLARLTNLCVKAIEEANKGNKTGRIDLPEGVHWDEITTGISYSTIPVYEVFRIYNLYFWYKE